MMIYTLLSLPCAQQHVGWATKPGGFGRPLCPGERARERQREAHGRGELPLASNPDERKRAPHALEGVTERQRGTTRIEEESVTRPIGMRLSAT